MNRWIKLAVVLAGYVLAFVTSSVLVAIDDRQFSPADNQAMGGMIAGGEMMYGIAVFLLVALVPTALALWFLRRHRKSWSLVTNACLGFAVAGLVAVLAMVATRGAAARVPVLALIGLFSLAQMLGSPLWIATFGLFALLAPACDLRMRMIVAAAIEVVIAGCGLVLFLLQPAI